MKFFYSLLAVIFIGLAACQQTVEEAPSKQVGKKFNNYQEILDWIENPTDDYVALVAHRGDWRNAPENSLRAVQNCIEMGIEIVEIDVRMTKDSQLIVIHDTSLDRTTTGKGKIRDWTLDSIRTLSLKNGAGMTTHHPIPTLEEMMLMVKGEPVLLNLDKAWAYLPETFEILKNTGTIEQAIFKGNDPYEVMLTMHGTLMDSMQYMPMVWPPDYNIYKSEEDMIKDPIKYTKDYIEGMDPMAFEVIYSKEESVIFDAIKMMEDKRVAVWVNTLWARLCAGHHDDIAIDAPDEHWGWVIRHGANIIQTDRPKDLITYLKGKGLR